MASNNPDSSRKPSSTDSRGEADLAMGCSYPSCSNVASRDKNCTDTNSYTNAVSGGKKLRVCANCRITRYCCREHQKKDWKAHKSFCKEFATLINAEHPHPTAHGLARHSVMLRSFEARLDAHDVSGAIRKGRELMAFSYEALPRLATAKNNDLVNDAQIVSCLCLGRAATQRDPHNHLEYSAWDQGIRVLQIGLRQSIRTNQPKDIEVFHLILAHAFALKEDCESCQEHLDALKPYEPLDDVWDTETLWKTKCTLATLRADKPEQVIELAVAWMNSNDVDTRLSTFKYKFTIMARSLYFVAGLLSVLPVPRARVLALQYAERTVLLLEKNQDKWVDTEHSLMYYRMTGILSSLYMRLGRSGSERAGEVLLKNVNFAKAHPELR